MESRYQVLESLGDGTYGKVSRAVNRRSGEIVAIKQMKRRFYTWDECLKLREVRSLKVLSHENIVKLKEVIRENNQLFFVFEFLERNVYQLIRDRDATLDEAKICAVMFQCLQGLAHMHKVGFFHRDIKPENIVLKKRAGVSEDWGIDANELELERSLQLQRSQGLQSHLEECVKRLESERIELLNELRRKAVQNGEDSFTFFGLNSDKMALVEEYADRLRENDNTLPISEFTAEKDAEILSLRAELSHQRQRFADVVLDLDDTRRQLLAAVENSHHVGVDRILESLDVLRRSNRRPMDMGANGGDDANVMSPSRLASKLQWAFVRKQVPRSTSAPPRATSGSPLPLDRDDENVYDADGRHQSGQSKETAASPDFVAMHDLGEVLGAVGEGAVHSSSRMLACIEELLRTEQALGVSSLSLAKHESEIGALCAHVASLFEEHASMKRKYAEAKRDMESKIDSLQDDNDLLTAQNRSLSSHIENLKTRIDSGESGAEDLSEKYRSELFIANAQLAVLSRKSQAQESALALLEESLTSSKSSRLKMERVLRTRLVQVQGAAEASEKARVLCEQELANSVSRDEHDRVVRAQELANMRLSAAEVRAADMAKDACNADHARDELESWKSRAELAEDAIESKNAAILILQRSLDEISSSVSGDASQERVQLLAKVAALEVREANEARRRVRAESALEAERVRREDVSSDLLELEKRFVLAQQDVYRAREERLDAEEKLANEVLRSKQVPDEKHAQAQTSTAAASHSECGRCAVAARQALQARRLLEEKSSEVDSLRRALLVLDERSDESTRLGRAIREGIAAKMEVNALRSRVEELEREHEEQEARLGRAFQARQTQQARALKQRQFLRSRVQALYKLVSALREEVSPALSAEQARAVCESNACVTNRLKESRKALVHERQERHKAEHELAKAQILMSSRSDTEQAFAAAVEASGASIDSRVRVQIAEWSRRLRDLKLERLDLEHGSKALRSKLEFIERELFEREEDVRRLHRVVAEKDAALEQAHLRIRQSAAGLAPLNEDDQMQDEPTRERRDHQNEGVDEYDIVRVRAELLSVQAMLDAKDEMVASLRLQMNRLASQGAREAAVPSRDSVPVAMLAEKERVLRTAESTITSLQSLLVQKNASIERYAQLLEQALLQHKHDQSVDRKELQRLHDRLMHDNENANAALHDALQKIDEVPQRASDVVSAEHMREIMSERDARQAATEAELEASKHREQRTMKRCQEAQETVVELENRIAELSAELEPAERMIELIETLRSDLREKDRKQNQLEQAIVALKAEMVAAVNAHSSSLPDSSATQAANERILSLERQLKEAERSRKKAESASRNLFEQGNAVREQLENQKQQVDQTQKASYDIRDENKRLRADFDHLRASHQRLSIQNQRLKKDIESFEGHIERLRSEAALAESEKSVVGDLQDQIEMLKQRIALNDYNRSEDPSHQRHSSNPVLVSIAIQTAADREASLESGSSERLPLSGRSSASGNSAFEAWEGQKRLERRIELLKSKLRERSSTVKSVEDRAATLAKQVSVVEKDKSGMILRIRELEQELQERSSAGHADGDLGGVESLRKQLFDAEEKIQILRRKVDVDNEKERRLLLNEIRVLQEQLREKEKDRDALRRPVHAEVAKLRQEIDTLEKRLLDASCDNLELRFDAEQAGVTNLRLRKRIRELDDLLERANSRSGEEPSEKLEELKQALESVSKLADKLRKENETLKKNSHSHAKYMDTVRALRRSKAEASEQVDALKNELKRVSEQITVLQRSDSAAKLRQRQHRKEVGKVRKERDTAKSDADKAAEQVGLLQGSVSALEKQVDILSKTNKQQQSSLVTLQKERDELRTKLEHVQAEASVDPAEADVRAESAVSAEQHRQDIAVLNNALTDANERCRELEIESDALKNELSAFDASFFDEIEDLKMQYHQATERLLMYQHRFGSDIPEQLPDAQ